MNPSADKKDKIFFFTITCQMRVVFTVNVLKELPWFQRVFLRCARRVLPENMGGGVSPRWKPLPYLRPKYVILLTLRNSSQLNCDSTAMVTYSFHLYSRSSHHFGAFNFHTVSVKQRFLTHANFFTMIRPLHFFYTSVLTIRRPTFGNF